MNSRPVTSDMGWAQFQRRWAGDREVRLRSELGRPIWADGLGIDPDQVVALEAKYVSTPGKGGLYEGGVPPELAERMLARTFDDEMRRYAAVIADRGNPVGRLRLYVNTQAAADFLGTRARALLGPGTDLQIVVRSG